LSCGAFLRKTNGYVLHCAITRMRCASVFE
jgi:hypothetical protein